MGTPFIKLQSYDFEYGYIELTMKHLDYVYGCVLFLDQLWGQYGHQTHSHYFHVN